MNNIKIGQGNAEATTKVLSALIKCNPEEFRDNFEKLIGSIKEARVEATEVPADNGVYFPIFEEKHTDKGEQYHWIYELFLASEVADSINQNGSKKRIEWLYGSEINQPILLQMKEMKNNEVVQYILNHPNENEITIKQSPKEQQRYRGKENEAKREFSCQYIIPTLENELVIHYLIRKIRRSL